MKNEKQRKGSVLMEYLVVLVFIGATLALSSSRLFYSYIPADQKDQGFDYAGNPRANPPGFGTLGMQFVGFYQRTMGGLSLPVP